MCDVCVRVCVCVCDVCVRACVCVWLLMEVLVLMVQILQSHEVCITVVQCYKILILGTVAN